MISKHSEFPKDYLRAYCEYMACKPSQVEHDGAEFHHIEPKSGHCKGWKFVHTEEEVKAAELTIEPEDIFVCAKGVRWVIIPL